MLSTNQRILTLIEETFRNHQFNNDRKTLFFATSLSRFRNLLDAAILLAENDLVKESSIICRTLFELAFKVKGVANDEELLEKVCGEHHVQIRKNLAKFINGDLDFDGEDSAPFKEKYEEIEKIIKEYNLKQIQKRDLAEKAELLGAYLTTYDTLSDSVHISISDLDSLIRFKDENPESIVFGRDPEDKDYVVLLTAYISLILYKVFCEYFEKDNEQTIIQLRDKIKKQFDKIIEDS